MYLAVNSYEMLLSLASAFNYNTPFLDFSSTVIFELRKISDIYYFVSVSFNSEEILLPLQCQDMKFC